jgi:hypothetical protein
VAVGGRPQLQWKAWQQGQGRAKARRGHGEGRGGARGGGARAQETKVRRGPGGRARPWLQQQGCEGSGARPCEQEGHVVQGEVAGGTVRDRSPRYRKEATCEEKEV